MKTVKTRLLRSLVASFFFFILSVQQSLSQVPMAFAEATKGPMDHEFTIKVICSELKANYEYNFLSSEGTQILKCQPGEKIHIVKYRPEFEGVHQYNLLAMDQNGKIQLVAKFEFEVTKSSSENSFDLTNPLVIGALLSSLTFVLNQMVIDFFSSRRKRKSAIGLCRTYARTIMEGLESNKMKVEELPKPPFEIEKFLSEAEPSRFKWTVDVQKTLLDTWKLSSNHLSHGDAIRICKSILS